VLSLSVCVCVVALSLCKHDEFVECLRCVLWRCRCVSMTNLLSVCVLVDVCGG